MDNYTAKMDVAIEKMDAAVEQMKKSNENQEKVLLLLTQLVSKSLSKENEKKD